MKSAFTIAGLMALISTAQATIPDEYFEATVSTSGPESSLSGYYLHSGPNVNGDTSVSLTSTGDDLLYIDELNHLILVVNFVVVGAAYIDHDDHGLLKFNNDTQIVGNGEFTSSNTTHDFVKFDVNNFTLVAQNSAQWSWCPLDGAPNGTLALGPTTGDGCQKIDSLSVAYTD
ncbi:hypothetical protein BGW36DRAFT_465301 [Talaromyces proteolyticus]|uniref:Cell wall protein n=1 Tax=Talaromyces proteolyticus TaxID=1131652 RepID=A0AAD4PW69_9EURO|nr:uncharacterized protein BGW36DRAFT_465301 [Talaromyces proteolyticus]KAH8691582.1 hypothetical protein BGW36DRAFT_465301 [Talaromyces proteolyticus]